MNRRETFAVGRVTRKTSELVLRIRRDAPFPGPWKLAAVVGPGSGRTAPGPDPTPTVIPFPGAGRRNG